MNINKSLTDLFFGAVIFLQSEKSLSPETAPSAVHVPECPAPTLRNPGSQACGRSVEPPRWIGWRSGRGCSLGRAYLIPKTP